MGKDLFHWLAVYIALSGVIINVIAFCALAVWCWAWVRGWLKGRWPRPKTVEATCGNCGGRGKADLYQLSDYFDPCPICNGTGKVKVLVE